MTASNPHPPNTHEWFIYDLAARRAEKGRDPNAIYFALAVLRDALAAAEHIAGRAAREFDGTAVGSLFSEFREAIEALRDGKICKQIRIIRLDAKRGQNG